MLASPSLASKSIDERPAPRFEVLIHRAVGAARPPAGTVSPNRILGIATRQPPRLPAPCVGLTAKAPQPPVVVDPKVLAALERAHLDRHSLIRCAWTRPRGAACITRIGPRRWRSTRWPFWSLCCRTARG
jgi:hypothetical protein